jgi:hypothetical protein
MPTLTIQYVYFGASGAHTRQPRATGSYGGFTPIPGLNGGGTATLSPGTPYQPLPADPSLEIGSLSLQFAFTNVSGLVEGPRTSFDAATPPASGTVGSNAVVVMYVYVPSGSAPGTGDSGAVIDAFDASTNSLVDNDFVAVTPDPGGTITNEANVDGWVDTESSGYTITADHPNIGPYLSLSTSPLFDQWVDLTNAMPPSSLISGADLTPTQGQTVYALAFYHDPVHHKGYLEKNPSEFVYKVIGDMVKSPKEAVENPGFGNIGDPGELIGQLNALNRRLATLEARLDAFGSAFIKQEDRPSVGRQNR